MKVSLLPAAIAALTIAVEVGCLDMREVHQPDGVEGGGSGGQPGATAIGGQAATGGQLGATATGGQAGTVATGAIDGGRPDVSFDVPDAMEWDAGAAASSCGRETRPLTPLSVVPRAIVIMTPPLPRANSAMTARVGAQRGQSLIAIMGNPSRSARRPPQASGPA
jgi:hypothetical protein